MGRKISDAGEVALVLLGEIPAIGSQFRSKERAIWAAQGLLRAVDYLINNSCFGPYQIIFKHQGNGCYTLVIKNNTLSLEMLHFLKHSEGKTLRSSMVDFKDENSSPCPSLYQGLQIM